MRSLILLPFLFLLMSFPGCPEDRVVEKPPVTPPPITDPEPPKPGKDGKTDPLAQAKYEMQLYAEKAAQAEARYDVLQRQATDDAIRKQTLWITGICLLLAAVAGVAAFCVPIGKKTLGTLAIGLTAIAACAQAFQWAIPYLPWIGGVLIVGGGVLMLVKWDKLGKATKTAADYGDRLEEWLQDLPEEARAQANEIIADAKDEAKKQAQRLGVHNPLQYLRGKSPSLWQRVTKKVG